MSTLLTIPRELRDIILEYVVTSLIAAPDYEADLHETRVFFPETAPHVNTLAGQRIFWQSRQTVHPAQALLFVDRQLHYETKDVWRRLIVLGKLTTHIDIMFASERQLRPTFLSLFNPSQHLETVRAEFRLVGETAKCEADASGFANGWDKSIWLSAAGRPAMADWMFYSFFQRFLQAGPSLHASTPDQHITIRTLDINVVSPPGPKEPAVVAPTSPTEEPTFQDMRVLAWRRGSIPTIKVQPKADEDPEDGEDAATRLRAEDLCHWIGEHLSRLTTMSMMEYGAILYERVGTIRILMNGKKIRVFELGSMLFELARHEQRYCGLNALPAPRRASFVDWRMSAEKVRRRASLPVVEVLSARG